MALDMHTASCALRDISADLPGYKRSLAQILVELTTLRGGRYPWASFTWKTATGTRSGTYATFTEYLGEWSRFTLDDLRRLFSDDDNIRTRLDAMTQEGPGRRATKRGPQRADGTSKEATLRRLRNRDPDLHQQVLDGKLSPNKAAIKAGWRPKTWTAPDDLDKLAVALERRYPGVFTRRK